MEIYIPNFYMKNYINGFIGLQGAEFFDFVRGRLREGGGLWSIEDLASFR